MYTTLYWTHSLYFFYKQLINIHFVHYTNSTDSTDTHYSGHYKPVFVISLNMPFIYAVCLALHFVLSRNTMSMNITHRHTIQMIG